MRLVNTNRVCEYPELRGLMKPLAHIIRKLHHMSQRAEGKQDTKRTLDIARFCEESTRDRHMRVCLRSNNSAWQRHKAPPQFKRTLHLRLECFDIEWYLGRHIPFPRTDRQRLRRTNRINPICELLAINARDAFYRFLGFRNSGIDDGKPCREQVFL